MEKVKEPKANWDSDAHTIFMNACIVEVRANNRNDGYLLDIGQANLYKKFNERSGRTIRPGKSKIGGVYVEASTTHGRH